MSAPWLPAAVQRAPGADALWNALMSYAGQRLPLGPRNALAVFAPGEAPTGDAFCLAIATARGPRLVVEPGAYPFRALFGVELDMADLAGLPPDLRDALAEGMVASLWAALPEARLGAPRLVAAGAFELVSDEAERARLTWFDATMAGVVPEPVSLRVGCEQALLVELFADGRLGARQVWPGLKARLTVDAHVTLGALPLTHAGLAALAEGTVVVLPERPEERCEVRLDGTLFAFQRAREGWTCLGGTPQRRYRDGATGSPAGGAPTMPADTPEPVSLQALPVVIDFDLGRLTVPLAEVESWAEGAVVALDPPVPGPGVEVTIRANGAVIGSGDLIRLDERLAVRITRLTLGA